MFRSSRGLWTYCIYATNNHAAYSTSLACEFRRWKSLDNLLMRAVSCTVEKARRLSVMTDLSSSFRCRSLYLHMTVEDCQRRTLDWPNLLIRPHCPCSHFSNCTSSYIKALYGVHFWLEIFLTNGLLKYWKMKDVKNSNLFLQHNNDEIIQVIWILWSFSYELGEGLKHLRPNPVCKKTTKKHDWTGKYSKPFT